MKALVLRPNGAPALLDRPVPRPRAGEVLVRTTAALVCAWDGHPASDEGLGHEAVGVVRAVGVGVPDAYLGLRVAAEGRGRLAEYFRVPVAGAGLVPLPDRITDHQALYAAGALATGLAAAEEAGAPAGGSVAVFGQGPVGLSATVAAGRLRGARVIAVEPEPRRQLLALRFGADVVVDPAYEDSAERIMELTGGAGADCAILATAAPGATAAARACTAPGGHVTLARCRAGAGAQVGARGARGARGAGSGAEAAEAGAEDSAAAGERTARMLDLIGDGLLDPTVMTTHEFPFTRVEEAFRRLSAREPGMVKPIVHFPRRSPS
ncbi:MULTISPECIES: zinc-binding dehydrogenase [unclassified Streptomyces]|uniref:zinc-binding dehydrogenase n=1 Tax=unclassified Streptomyces TaxID=2593676 RepID=UPI0036509E39